MVNQWFQHTLRRSGWRPRNQAVALATIGIIIALIFGSLYLSQVVSYATTNRQIGELVAERDALEFANEQLRADIASLKTVPRLLARAEELGFRKAVAADIEYLVIEGYDPGRGETVVPQDEDNVVDTPVYDETFSGWLQQQWDSLRSQFEGFGRRSE